MSDWVVVTGASRGIGRETALALAARGHAVALLGRPSPRLDEAAGEIATAGGVARVVPCNLGDEMSIRAAADTVLALAPPRVVVHNAGIVRRGAHVVDTRTADFREVLDVNLVGPFLLTRALLPAMLERRVGRFVFVSSISATLGSPGAASYAASKWGVTGLMKSLAEELRGSGLTSLGVLPGSVDTDMLRGSGFAPQMSARDVARLVEFAALDAPDAMNGSPIEMFG